MLLSKYVKIFDDIDEENYLLYNSVNRSIIFIPKNWYKNGKLKEEEIDKKFINELKEMDFFMTQEEAISYLEENVHEYNKLFISIETTLACNLRCPYCYQIGATHSKGMIDLKNIDLLIEYMEEVYKQQPFKQLNFKILGGEPTINPESMDYIIKKASKFCKEKNIIFFLLIDTNLTDISYLLNLNDYDKLLLNVPLTHKEIHDKYRVDAQGKGSYDTIIDNLNKMYTEKPDTEILLRYNTDEKNIHLFKSYIADLKQKLEFAPIISIAYTQELGKGNFENKLSSEEYSKWLSTEVIDTLLENDFPVDLAPMIALEECQGISPYSCKLFSDGTVGGCAMDFFSEKRLNLTDMVDSIKQGKNLLKTIKFKSFLENEKCLNCESIFLCGGTYMLPCYANIKNIEKCTLEGGFSINLKEYLKRYLNAIENGKEELFIAFK